MDFAEAPHALNDIGWKTDKTSRYTAYGQA